MVSSTYIRTLINTLLSTPCHVMTLTLCFVAFRDDGKLGEGGGDYVDWATPSGNSVLAAPPPTSSPFVSLIQEILHPSSGEFSPALK